MSLILIILSILFTSPTESNYVEIEIRLEKNDHIQLFIQGYDTIPKFSEKASFWKRLKGGKNHVIKWQLSDMEYQRIRIDISTKVPQTVAITSITYNLNGIRRSLKGAEILEEFVPNGFIEYVSSDANQLVFITKRIGDIFDPWLGMGNAIDSARKDPNTRMKIEFSADKSSIMSMEYYDSTGRLSMIHPYDTGTNLLNFQFYSEYEPDKIRIRPSVGNANLLDIKKLQFARNGKSITWRGDEIFSDFQFSLDFNEVDVQANDLHLEIVEKTGYRSASLELPSLIYPFDLIMKKLRTFSLLFVVSLFLFLGHRYLLESKYVEIPKL